MAVKKFRSHEHFAQIGDRPLCSSTGPAFALISLSSSVVYNVDESSAESIAPGRRNLIPTVVGCDLRARALFRWCRRPPMIPSSIRRNFRSAARLSWCAAVVGLSWAAVSTVDVSSAGATTYHVETRTAARATQHLRSDTTFATPRVLSQSLTLSAFDLRDNQQGDVNARLTIRYSTDLALAERLRQDPLFDARWNDLRLDVAYVEWHPGAGLEVTAGRQWHRNALGITDVDGLAVTWEADGDGWAPFFGITAGRDVQRGLTPWDPGAWDVQGLPPNEVVLDDPWHWMAATRAGITAPERRHRAEIAAEQHLRPRGDGSAHRTATRRLGATATASPAEPLTVTTTSSFHSTLGGLDRARLDVAYRFGDASVSTGVDHRRPVFDSSSIFNLFGAQPHRSAYATFRRPIESLGTTVEVRTWTRFYFDEQAPLWSAGDEQAIGAALVSRHQLEVVVPLDVMWQLSAQTLAGGAGGEQYLGNARLRAPGPVEGLFLSGRLLGLWAAPNHHRRPSGYAATAGLGAELELGEVGRFSLHSESRFGTHTRANTALFALFELETRR